MSCNRIARHIPQRPSGTAKAKAALGLGIAGCGLALALGGFALADAAGNPQDTTAATAAGAMAALAEQPFAASDEPASSAGTTAAATPVTVTVPDADDLFSNRDLAGTYDTAEAVNIALEGASASIAAGTAGVTVSEANGATCVTISAAGTYVFAGALDNGQIVVDAPDDAKVQIVLAGASVASDTGCALFVLQADKVFVTLAEGTENSLVATGASYEVADPEDPIDVDGAVFSKADLTLNGTGSLAVSSAQGHGIVTKDDLVVAGGSYTVEAAGHALSGKDSVRIADGSLALTAGKNGLDSDHDDPTKGFIYLGGGSVTVNAGNDGANATGGVYLMGGTLTVTAVDDGVHSDAALVAGGSTVDVLQSEEGLEGQVVSIEAGHVSVVSRDDGVNATAGTSDDAQGWAGGRGGMGGSDGSLLSISGGTLLVDAEGDGLDSNGDLVVTGGETYVNGPVSSGNAALDYSGSGTISGGVFVAVGAGGMAQGFGGASTQGALFVGTPGASGDVALLDAAGNVLVSFAPSKSYDTVLVSCPDLTVGSTYTLQAGGQTAEVTLDALVTSAGGMGAMGAKGGMGTMGVPGDMGAMGDMGIAGTLPGGKGAAGTGRGGR